MTNLNNPKDEPLVTKDANPDPEYQRLMSEYSDNPFHDITKDEIAAYVKKMEEEEKKDPEAPVEVV